MSDSEKTSTQLSRDSSFDPEEESFLGHNSKKSGPAQYTRRHVHVLYAVNLVLSCAVLALFWAVSNIAVHDPSLGVYSPANGAVEYIKEQPFRAALFNNTPYMGYPTDETDKLWEDLYNFGTSTISKAEADKLPNPTLPIPGTDRYLVQLDVWHQLHCLNDMRKLLYPDRFDGLEKLRDANGNIDMTDSVFRHWDHCIDALRQSIMCHADVSPISFHVNVPVAKGVFPRLATTHTCRDFSKIQQWAKDHQAGPWEMHLTPEHAKKIIKEANFDQSPFEDIEFMYDQFPGEMWFKYWRDHPEEAKVAREKLRNDAKIVEEFEA
ncbi:hypothetical protein GLAREA_03579 [Glarea lozoyensis ATCC 20868]|uniref:Uncharacterized protein n=1 Tax=Glarea lozoyensis (strain ATCC 20868 / MF5171) TaxID=1116229 RepID=S3CW28_GLAL2|nr:uncharacterized protein GLAREA_03579 [Glarea lozoyensis ATCC 20868]EPE30612.1 hypothetical protein GLAREA_03579 [Glarea lozoyensis ATCC 20868]